VGCKHGLVYVGDILQFCVGVIQNLEQRRCCCKTAGVCSTKGQKAKLSLSTKTPYVKHTWNGHARLEPNLPVSLLQDDVTVPELMGQDNLLEVWLAFSSLFVPKRAISSSTGSSSSWDKVASRPGRNSD
jgi:hypothetical protein